MQKGSRGLRPHQRAKMSGEIGGLRYQWYQSPTTVTIDVMVPGLREEDADVKFESNSVSSFPRKRRRRKREARHPFLFSSGGSELVLFENVAQIRLNLKWPDESLGEKAIELVQTIHPEKCKVKVLSKKMEIKLVKTNNSQWEGLEIGGQSSLLSAGDLDDGGASACSTKPRVIKDWSKIEKEVEEIEKQTQLQGDAALNKLFQVSFLSHYSSNGRACASSAGL